MIEGREVPQSLPTFLDWVAPSSTGRQTLLFSFFCLLIINFTYKRLCSSSWGMIVIYIRSLIYIINGEKWHVVKDEWWNSMIWWNGAKTKETSRSRSDRAEYQRSRVSWPIIPSYMFLTMFLNFTLVVALWTSAGKRSQSEGANPQRVSTEIIIEIKQLNSGRMASHASIKSVWCSHWRIALPSKMDFYF